MSASVSGGYVAKSSGLRTISITSGKGGVGKTTLVTNLASQLGKAGNSVLILDGDLGMANVDVMYATRTTASLRDVLRGSKRIDEVLHQVDQGVWVIPGGSGFVELENLSESDKRNILDQLSSIKQKFNYLFVDTGPGINGTVRFFNTCTQEIAVVVTPDPASITDAYALIKVLHYQHKENRFSIIANQVRDEQEGLAIYSKLSDVASRFLNVSLDYWGHVPLDVLVRRAVKNQQVFVRSSPEAPATFSIKRIIEKLNRPQNVGQIKGGVQFFWEQLIGAAS